MNEQIRRLNTWKLIISVAACEISGIVSSMLSGAVINPWFDNLRKPAWNPPSYLFGPVWAILYLVMGISIWLIWKSNKRMHEKEIAITFFVIQLFLNFWWSMLFFKFHSPPLALVDIILLLTVMILTAFKFFPISKTAAYLFIPYICWVAFATVLNYSIWVLNK